MTKRYHTSLHIFRRDLRLIDNTALIEALANSEFVIPCFIFDPRQIQQNPYKSDHCLSFMLHSLEELDQALRSKNSRLYCFYGQPNEIITKLLQEVKIDAVYLNRDYTPFSLERDKSIATLCKQNKMGYHCLTDALLHEPEEVLKPDGKPYTIFTHAFKRAAQLPISKPRNNLYTNYYTKLLKTAEDHFPLSLPAYPQLAVQGGRKEGLKLLKRSLTLSNYAEERNFPAKFGTSRLSAHNKFGTISIREVYHAISQALGPQHTLLTELYWRDFFTHIAFHFPRVFTGAFHQKYDQLIWENNETYFTAWCEGKTGFPIVDAGMRELNATGYMHNRVRMVTASFLVKDLHIDWRWGEKYFAQLLVDYDPAVNNGNWQWSASTGCDAQPYFRIFNPWLQQKKFDPDCEYIKHWIPELAKFSAKIIHTWPNISPSIKDHNYFHPVVDHASKTCKTQMMHRNIR